MNETAEQIECLKRLNQILREKEIEMVERCQSLTERYDARLSKNGSDLQDYEILFELQYVIQNRKPRWIISGIINKAHGLNLIPLFSLARGEDWREPGMPDFGEKWCFMMYSLYKRINILQYLCNISRIDNIITFTEKRCTKVGGNVQFFLDNQPEAAESNRSQNIMM
jgi:hypothetical protein